MIRTRKQYAATTKAIKTRISKPEKSPEITAEHKFLTKYITTNFGIPFFLAASISTICQLMGRSQQDGFVIGFVLFFYLCAADIGRRKWKATRGWTYWLFAITAGGLSLAYLGTLICGAAFNETCLKLTSSVFPYLIFVGLFASMATVAISIDKHLSDKIGATLSQGFIAMLVLIWFVYNEGITTKLQARSFEVVLLFRTLVTLRSSRIQPATGSRWMNAS